MAFEEDTHQQHNEELKQLQKQRENTEEQVIDNQVSQQSSFTEEEIDLTITRIENEQIQRDLDVVIEHSENFFTI